MLSRLALYALHMCLTYETRTQFDTQNSPTSCFKIQFRIKDILYSHVKVKVKQSHCRPGQTLKALGSWGPQISRQPTHKGGNVVNPSHRPSLSAQEIFLLLISVKGWVDPGAIVRPEGLCQWKIPVTPSGIDPATFRLVIFHVSALIYSNKYRLSPPAAKAPQMWAFGLVGYVNTINQRIRNGKW
jgi:hypothetical protein